MGKSSSFSLGFGYNLSKTMGVGLGAIIYSSDLDATVNASVPSPWVFNSPPYYQRRLRNYSEGHYFLSGLHLQIQF